MARADEWPQWRGPKRDGVWRETGLVEHFASDKLKLRWRVPLASGYSGPTVADGRVYVTDRLVEPKPIERVHAFDWRDGKTLWTQEYECPYVDVGYTDGPRASVTVDDGRAYSLGTMGNLLCLDAAKGDILWQKDLAQQYKIRMPIWGLAASPLVEGDLLVCQVGGPNACVVAFDKRSGEERWKALDDRASYSAPIVIEQGGQRVLVVWTGDNVVGLNPQSGDVYWRHPFTPTRMVIGIATPSVGADRLLVSSFYDGSLVLALDRSQPKVAEVWRRLGPDEQHTNSLHAMIGTPLVEGDYIYGVDSYGELRLPGCADRRACLGEPAGHAQEPLEHDSHGPRHGRADVDVQRTWAACDRPAFAGWIRGNQPSPVDRTHPRPVGQAGRGLLGPPSLCL